MKTSYLRTALLMALVVLLGFGCKGTSDEVREAIKPIELNYWRVFDGKDEFEDIIAKYRADHPHVNIKYKKLRSEEYERALLEAFAEDRGPDLFSIHNTWIGGYEKKITPLPKNLSVGRVVIEGSLKKEKKFILDEKKTPTPSKIQKAFVPVVAGDVIRDVTIEGEKNTVEKRIMGLPLSVDTMVMFYNNDVLAQSGIPTPPSDWVQFQNAVKSITKTGADDVVLQSGAGIGTASNVNRASDIISLLMMQNGANMADNFGRAIFNQTPPELSGDRELPPGVEALIFYTEFANPLETVYTWNARMPDSFEAFADGKTGFFFGYNYHIPLLKSRAPKLNYSYVTAPQLNPNHNVNHASYWVETVSKKAKHPQEAWDFLLFATQPQQAKTYLEKTDRPTALRELIEPQLEDTALEPFVSQLLTAKSWYKGKDSNAMESIMHDMIEEALANAPIDPKEAFENAINRAVSRINQTL